jgi:HK97 family phage prohead protease
MLPLTIEKRLSNVEIRADSEGKKFVGRAVVYNEPSNLIYGHFREEILPGAFDESLRSGRDVYCSIDHDMNRLLGRQSAGTLLLKPDERGIDVEVPIPDYSYAKDLALAIQRRDLTGMSFIFDVLDDDWSMKDGKRHRTVKKADLYEVAFVFFPAYPETEAGMRNIPRAYPVAGEQRAMSRMFERFDKPELERMKQRMRLALSV